MTSRIHPAMRTFPAILLLAGSSILPATGQHAGDVLIGRNSASQLIASNLPADTVRLPFVSSGINVGWASTSLGFDRILNATPAADLYPMTGTGMIDLEVISIDPGLSFRSFTAFNTVIADAPGESLRMGPAHALHYHPIVFIDANAVGQEFNSSSRAIVRFVDASGSNSPSPPCTLTFSPPPAVSRTYSLRTLDVHDALHSSADSISNSGIVTGTWQRPNHPGPAGVLHSASDLQTLVQPSHGFASLRMTGVNRNGDSIGSQDNDGFLLKDGILTPLTLPAATNCLPRAISDTGHIVGVATSATGLIAWSRSPDGTFTTLQGLPGYTDHAATGINNQGDIIGSSSRPAPGGSGTESTPWIQLSGITRAITFAGTSAFSPIAINDNGDTLVSYQRAATGSSIRHAVRTGTVWSELFLNPLPDLSDYRITSLNNHGEIVGTCSDSTGRLHGFRGRPAWLPSISAAPATLSPLWNGSQLMLSISPPAPSPAFEPNAVTIHAGPAARRRIPSTTPFSFLGTPGSAIWILPDRTEPLLPQIVITPPLPQGVFVSDRIHLDLEKSDGPGHLFVYRTNPDRTPVVLLDTSNGLSTADRITTDPSAPDPLNWAFTAPGAWQLTFRLRATLSATNTEIVSTPQAVSLFIEPGSIVPPTITFVTTNPSATALLVSGEVGRECLLRSSHDLVSWHITHRILTTSPHTLFPADLNATRQFYQAMFR